MSGSGPDVKVLELDVTTHEMPRVETDDAGLSHLVQRGPQQVLDELRHLSVRVLLAAHQLAQAITQGASQNVTLSSEQKLAVGDLQDRWTEIHFARLHIDALIHELGLSDLHDELPGYLFQGLSSEDQPAEAVLEVNRDPVPTLKNLVILLRPLCNAAGALKWLFDYRTSQGQAPDWSENVALSTVAVVSSFGRWMEGVVENLEGIIQMFTARGVTIEEISAVGDAVRHLLSDVQLAVAVADENRTTTPMQAVVPPESKPQP